MHFGYGPRGNGWDDEKSGELAEALERIVVEIRTEVTQGMAPWIREAWPEGKRAANGQESREWTPGDWPYVERNGPMGGPAVRRITRLPVFVVDELTKRCDEAYHAIMERSDEL